MIQTGCPGTFTRGICHEAASESLQVYIIYRNKYKEAAKMGGQRNMPQRKEQENYPEELNEMEGSNLSDIEFRVMILRILNSIKKDI